MYTVVKYYIRLCCRAVLFALFFCLATIVFAASSSIDTWATTTELVEEIYENPNFLPLIDVDKAKVTLQDLATSLQQMQVDYEQVDSKRTYIETRYAEMASSIEQTIDATAKNKETVLETLTTISLLEHRIAWLKEELTTLKSDLSLSRSYVTEYVLFLYQSYQQLYGNSDSVSRMKQLIATREVDVSLNAQHFAEMLTSSLEKQLLEIQEKQKAYILKVKELHNAKLSYYQLAKSLQKDMFRLEEQKKYLYAQLRSLQTDKSALDKRAAQLRRSQESLNEQVNKVKKMTMENEQWLSDKVALLLELPDRSVGKNYFTRPILSTTYISSLFGELIISDVTDVNKKTTDYIRAEIPQWELVFAAAPWIVYKVILSESNEEQRIMLLHKKWFVSFYRPLEDIFVKEGQIVRRGQIIGVSGGQPWTRGAGIQSVGPHFDFSLYLNGDAVDPYNYLDLSVLDEKKVPEQRKQKQRDDKYAREVPLDDIAPLPGKTIEERRDAFLRRYAQGPYGDAGLWYDAAEWQWIDPLMGICVWFAETGFKNFKTPNNIGNVWNNDRGDVVEYQSPIVGARALYSVLNNQYLWNYHTLNELSRFGNSDGFIYASSPYNRQRNIMRCLSAIYGYPIPEDFPFRRMN